MHPSQGHEKPHARQRPVRRNEPTRHAYDLFLHKSSTPGPGTRSAPKMQRQKIPTLYIAIYVYAKRGLPPCVACACSEYDTKERHPPRSPGKERRQPHQ